MIVTKFLIILIIYRIHATREKHLKKVASFNCQGSQTGQEVRNDLFFMLNPSLTLLALNKNRTVVNTITISCQGIIMVSCPPCPEAKYVSFYIRFLQ
jgi:hypothetical protein